MTTPRSTLTALPRPAASTAGPRAAGLRITGLAHRVFTDRTEPVVGVDAGIAREVLAAYGGDDALGALLDRHGKGFVSMGGELLGLLPEPVPDQQAVLLAYHTPDLFTLDVAGLYLAQRLPGDPVPCSVDGQGPGAPFTALRIALGLSRIDALRHGTVFVLDQNAGVWGEQDIRQYPDAGVVLSLGGGSGAAIGELAEIPTDTSECPGPSAALAAAAARHPGAAVLVGNTLAGVCDPAADLAVARYSGARVEIGEPGALCTGVWALLARAWPISEPVLLADFDPAGERFYSCLLIPETEP